MSDLEFTVRYQALGLPLPDPETMCDDQGEGTGWVPIHRDDDEEPWHTLWLEAEEKSTTDDGYHFVKCPSCQPQPKEGR